MDREEVSALVDAAIARVIDSEHELLDRNVSERALTHHLARFLREGVPRPFVVDVEYNRHIDDPKRLLLPPRQAADDELRATTVFPDIIVHVRGTDDHNLLVLEVKKPGGDLEYDAKKLTAFREQLHYRHAAHVILGHNANEDTVQEVIWAD